MSKYKYKLVEQDEPNEGHFHVDILSYKSENPLTEEYIHKSNNLLKRLDNLVKQGEELLEKRKKNGFKK